MNIYDIAREAGVSIATISRVINGKSVVSAKTREKVEAVLKKYNYTPDPTARSLVVKSTKSVSILVDDVSDPFYGSVCRAVERELSRISYTSILCNTGSTVKGIADGIKSALAHRADAIVIAGMTRESHNDISAAAKSVPVVLVNDFLDAPNVYSVICDEVYGMMLAVSHLVSRGKQDIIYVQDCDSNLYAARRLDEGFTAGMAMNDLSSDDRTFITERGFDGGYALAETLIREGRQFNAVICGDDTTAAGFMKYLTQNYFDVPEDKAVVGFRNTPCAQCSNPQLTSVDCRGDQVGAGAVKQLSAIFEGKQPKNKLVVLPRLVVRESS